jgi:hypothetical protein
MSIDFIITSLVIIFFIILPFFTVSVEKTDKLIVRAPAVN